MWPNWLFFSKDLWFDLLSGFSFLTIFWPLLPSKSTQQEEKEYISIYPLYIGPILCPISSLSIQSSISEPGRSALSTLIKWFSNGLKSPTAAKSLQSCPTLCDPIDGSPPGSPSLGFSRQEYWSGLPFPSPMHESERWKWSRSWVWVNSGSWWWTERPGVLPSMGSQKVRHAWATELNWR